MATMPKVVVQVRLSAVKAVFGEKVWDSVVKMSQTLKQKLEGDTKFTGQIVFTVNCRNGGIGNVSAYIPQKI